MTDLTERLLSEARERFTPCGDGRMIWRRWGKQDSGRKLFLLHGGFGSWRHWIRNIDALREGREVIAADMPGQGDSDMPPTPYTAESLAEIVAAGMRDIMGGDTDCDLAGFSFGGVISGLVAKELGNRVRNLVLVGATGFGIRSGATKALIRIEPHMSEDEKQATHRHNLAVLMFSDPSMVDDAALEIQITNTRKNRIRSRPISMTNLLAEALPDVSASIHAIWGDLDVTSEGYFDDRRAKLQAAQADARMDLLEGVGHWTQYEQPDAVNRLILETILGD